ncbi:YebG family protein [Pseudaeromonas paramecii]|uniref:YebG family protein n=1 Tax=Pseudaeromonas paramecii TaxID=2138166 RepID=A0ABP8Q2Y1_9GAMM
MAVEIKYVVVRNGEEKMTFASKKEADAYDKMLDMADQLTLLLAEAPVNLSEDAQEALALYLAGQKEALQQILKGGSLSVSETSDLSEVPQPDSKPARKPRKAEADAA